MDRNIHQANGKKAILSLFLLIFGLGMCFSLYDIGNIYFQNIRLYKIASDAVVSATALVDYGGSFPVDGKTKTSVQIYKPAQKISSFETFQPLHVSSYKEQQNADKMADYVIIHALMDKDIQVSSTENSHQAFFRKGKLCYRVELSQTYQPKFLTFLYPDGYHVVATAVASITPDKDTENHVTFYGQEVRSLQTRDYIIDFFRYMDMIYVYDTEKKGFKEVMFNGRPYKVCFQKIASATLQGKNLTDRNYYVLSVDNLVGDRFPVFRGDFTVSSFWMTEDGVLKGNVPVDDSGVPVLASLYYNEAGVSYFACVKVNDTGGVKGRLLRHNEWEKDMLEPLPEENFRKSHSTPLIQRDKNYLVKLEKKDG